MTKTNKEYPIELRLFLQRYLQRKNSYSGSKRTFYLDITKGDIKAARHILMQKRKKDADTIIYEKDADIFDGFTVVYRKPFCFKGTKAEAEQYLMENHATRIASDYDCTGREFTKGYKLGYLGNNLWKVAEMVGIDV